LAAWFPPWKKTGRWFRSDGVLSAKDQRKVDRFILFALAAAEEALAQANWKPALKRIACAQQRSSLQGSRFPRHHRGGGATVDLRAVPPPVSLYGAVLPGELAAGQISIHHGLKGPFGRTR